MADLRSHLRAGQHDDEQGQSRQQHVELDHRAEARHVWHQLLHQFLVAELAQALLLLAHSQETDNHQHGDDCQQIQIYGVFKSEHCFNF